MLRRSITSIYTHWWVWPIFFSLAYLSHQRNVLFENNLIDVYVSEEWPTSPEPCEGTLVTARTIDGSCNDLDLPGMGMAGTRMGRNVPIEYTYRDDASLMTPNPRELSKALMTRDEFQQVDFLSLLATSWIQFMIHDWFDHGDGQEESISIPVDSDDPLGSMGSMQVSKSITDSTTEQNGLPDTFINTNTAWWDGSQIYGSDSATNAEIRSFVDGKLKISTDNRLPIDPASGQSNTGFEKNWWVGLDMWHTLFTLEHNYAAEMFKQAYPEWDDETLYHHARLTTAAIMAKIHTVDWTPSILKNHRLRVAMNANWYGLFADPRLDELFDSPALVGIIGNPKDLFGTPFSLTEEFTAVYRMHPLLPDYIDFNNYADGQPITKKTLPDTAFAAATSVMDEVGLANSFYSFGLQHPGQLVLNNYPQFLQNFPVGEGQWLDLAAVDILRDRERGVPRYNELRRLINLKPINDFSDITPNHALAEKLREMYEDDVEQIDALVGQLAEGYRPSGYGFGETSFQIFIAMASRRLFSDRFYTDDYRPEIYTQLGLDYINSTDARTLLLRHMPELEGAMEKVGNPFFPWDEDSLWWLDDITYYPPEQLPY